MQKLAIWLALAFLAGCSSPPPEVATEASTTDAPPTSGAPTSASAEDTTVGAGMTTMSDSTGEEVCPPMPPEDGGYDGCPGLCGGGGQCFNDGQEYAVCTRGCFMDCNCWPAPAGDGDAPARCSDALLASTSVCVLDCSAGQTCPRGMFCVADLGICAHPYPGSGETTDGTTGGSSDSGSTGSSSDSGSTGSSSDTGSTDTGSTGSGSTDSGSTGSGSTDSGSTDSGSTGSGSTDSGSTGGSSSTGVAT